MSSYAAFVSYSREDSEFALRLAQDLKKAGAHIWLDQMDIQPGHPWDNAIEEALMGSPLMLLILSPASAKSENVRNEISFALEQGKTVIPVLYMSCVVPLRLQRTQRIDFRSDYARGLTSLLEQLQVSRPDPTVIQKVVEDDAQRQAAWRARELQAQKLAERMETQDAIGPIPLSAPTESAEVAPVQLPVPAAPKPAPGPSPVLYELTRDGQTYGPYTLEDLQRFLAGGSVLATDFVKSEQVPGLTTVSKLLGIPSPTPAGDARPTVVPKGHTSIAAPVPGAAQVAPDREALAKQVRIYRIVSIALFAFWIFGAWIGLGSFAVICFLFMIVTLVQFVRIRRKLNAVQA